jgi:hypothetical protein
MATNTNINIPIPQNPIGENYAWRDWFQKLSNKVFGSIASQNSSGINITGGNIDGTAIGYFSPSTGNFTSIKTQAPIDIHSGGTNGTANPTAGAVAYGTGASYAFSSAGTLGQVLVSGGSGTPTWVTGLSVTITTAKLTPTGTNGSMTFTDGILTSQTQAT